jgi:cytoskeletal protein CcmA (bactofilin family)
MEPKAARKKLAPEGVSKEAPWTLIGPGSTIHGELLMVGNVLVHGRVEGVVFTDGEVLVAPGAWVEGGIHARRIVIEGALEGRLEAAEEAVLRRGAVVRGDIEAQILTMDDGARFIGNWIRTEHRTGLRILPTESRAGNA